jgi:peptidoglycan/LPS O-acetylase OafA/YrhL
MGIVTHHFATKLDSPALQALFVNNYTFVDFFFVISGFVIFMNYGDGLRTPSQVADFLRNRLARIYPLHLVTFLAVALIGVTVWRGRSDIDLIVPSAVLPNLLLLHAWNTTDLPTFNTPSWSISAEWFCYLVFPLVAALARRSPARALVLLSLLTGCGLQLMTNLGIIRSWTVLTYDFGLLRALPTFLAGVALGKFTREGGLPSMGFGWSLGLFAAALVGMAGGLDDRLVLLLLVATVWAAVCAEHNGARGWLTHPLMARLGDLSYGVYLTHGLVAVVFLGFLGHRVMHLHGMALTLWCAAVALGPTLFVAWIAYHWIEMPARRRLRARHGRDHGESFVTKFG